jgi:SAM-dependent methyltransferase
MAVSEDAPPRKSSFPPPKNEPVELDVDLDDDEEEELEVGAALEDDEAVEESVEADDDPEPEPEPKRDSVVVRGAVTITDHPSVMPPPGGEVEIPKAPRVPSAAPSAPPPEVEAASGSDRPLAETIEEQQVDPSVPADADDSWLEESSTEITIEAADPDDADIAAVEVELDEEGNELDEGSFEEEVALDEEPEVEEVALDEEPEVEEVALDEADVEPEVDLEPEEEEEAPPEPSVSEVTEELDISAISEVAEEGDDLEIEEEIAADEIEEATPPPPPDKKDMGNSAPPPPPTAAKAEKAPPPAPPSKKKEKPAEGKAPPPPPDEKAATAAVAASQKRRRSWFETFFNDDYLRTVPAYPYKHVARQCDFIQEILKLPPGSTILDVGCGLGLHALELRSRGYLVVGLDLSLPMLSRAADEAQDRGVKINFLHSDMREMTFEGAFDAILCWGTTFGYFDDESNKKVLERLYQALKPRGLLLLDIVNRDFVVRQQPNLVWFEGDGCVCMEETQFNFIKDRLEVKRTVILDDGRQRETYYSVRLYTLHEIGQLMHHQGFRVASISGQEATPNVFFGADSPRMIILAERRAKKGEAKAKSDGKAKPPPAPPSQPPPDEPEELGLEDVEVEELSPPKTEEKTKPEAKALREAEADAAQSSQPPQSGDPTTQPDAKALKEEAEEAKAAAEAPEVSVEVSPDDYVDEGDTVVGGEFPIDEEADIVVEEEEDEDAAGVTDPDGEDEEPA